MLAGAREASGAGAARQPLGEVPQSRAHVLQLAAVRLLLSPRRGVPWAPVPVRRKLCVAAEGRTKRMRSGPLALLHHHRLYNLLFNERRPFVALDYFECGRVHESVHEAVMHRENRILILLVLFDQFDFQA